MTRKLIALATLVFAALVLTAPAQAASWEAGKHYTVLPQAQRTNVPAGKVEVMEVFSYGCPACDRFVPAMKRLKATLPPNAQIVYLPASWKAAENWPLFQRAYITASPSASRIKRTRKCSRPSGRPASSASSSSGQLKKKLPSIEDAAKFYERVTGVKAADFVAASKSFGVDMKVRQADAQILAMRITGTPSLVVNGKYGLNNDHLSLEEIIDLVKIPGCQGKRRPRRRRPSRSAIASRALRRRRRSARSTPAARARQPRHGERDEIVDGIHHHIVGMP